MIKKILAVTLSSIMLFSLAACTAPQDNTKKAEDTISIEHAMGTTEVPKAPKKVVILTNEGTEALLALGVKPAGAANSWTEEWYPHIKKDMEGVKGLGKEDSINLEAVAALKPDLIIGNKMRHEKIYSKLQSIAPTVFSNTLRGEWKENFKFYSKVLSKEAEGEKLIADFDNRIKTIKESSKDKLDTKVSLVRFMSGKTRIYLGDTFSGIILKEIGFARPEAQQATDKFVNEIGKERLNEADGDVMFYFTYETGDGKGLAREKEWLEDPMFKSLNAVKNNKAFKVDDVIWNTAGGIKAANLMLDDLENFIDKM